MSLGDRKAVIKNADMPEEVQQEAIDYAIQALEKYVLTLYNTEFVF
jgi:dynein light chain LC8-type